MATHSYAGKRTTIDELVQELLGMGLRSCEEFGSHWNEYLVRRHMKKWLDTIPVSLHHVVLQRSSQLLKNLSKIEIADDSYFAELHNAINAVHEYLKGISIRVTSHVMPELMRGISINTDDAGIRELAKAKALERVCVAGIRDAEGNAMGVQTAIKTAGHLIGHAIPGQTEDSQLARISCPTFWRREIRKALRPWRNLMHIAIAPERIKYACTDAIAEYRSMQLNAEEWASKTVLVNQTTGECIPMPTPETTAKGKYAQLVAITKGIELSAQARGLTAKIITLTLPTEYHPTTTRGKARIRVPNEHYDSALTPAVGQRELQSRWTRFRAAIKRRGIDWEFTLGCQPHKDESPHWHIVMWVDEKCWSEVEELIYKYFKMNSSDHQIDIQAAESAHGASSYAMRMLKYITRQMDPTMSDEDAQEAESASAWASAWKIRRYRTSHCKVTMWRMARSPEVKLPLDLKYTAQGGDYFGFMKLTEQYKCKLEYTQKLGRYGDSYKSPQGISYSVGSQGQIEVAYKYTQWVQESKAAYELNQVLLEVSRTVTCKCQDAASGVLKSDDLEIVDSDPPNNLCGPPDPWVEIISEMIKKYM
jgi:hypothetical protein